MARSVSVSMGITTGQTNRNLKTVLSKLLAIKDNVKEINKKGINIQTGTSIKGAEKLETIMKKNNTAIGHLNATIKGYSKNMKDVGKAQNNVAKSAKSASKEVTQLAGSMAFMGLLRRNIPTFLKFEDSIYNLGVVSKLSVSEIERLKGTLLGISADLPQTATELAMATDVIVRTGQTLPSALKVVTEASRLATASGESLANTVQIVNKILVAMGIEAEEAGRSMQTLHSVSINTATDLAKMGQASKYWASALATFSNITNRGGEELKEYRQELFDFGAVMTGVFANIGRDSTMGGTGIRTMASKMVGLEATAKTMLDNDLISRAVKVDVDEMKKSQDGIQLTADMLNELASKDLPKAVNLLSELYTKGDITQQTINKMFTTRQGLAISNALQIINGDWETYANRVKTASDLTEDFEKQMFNLNNQLGEMKSKFVNIFTGMGETAKDSLGVTATGINNLIDLMQKAPSSIQWLTDIALSTTVATAGIQMLALSFKKLAVAITGATSVKMFISTLFTGPWSLAIAGVVGLTAVVGKLVGYTNKLKQEQISYIKSLDDSRKKLEEVSEELRVAKGLNDILSEVDITNHWTGLETSLRSYSEVLKGVEKLYKNFESIDFSKKLNMTQDSLRKELESAVESRNRKGEEARRATGLMNTMPQYKSVKSEIERLKADREALMKLKEEADGSGRTSRAKSYAKDIENIDESINDLNVRYLKPYLDSIQAFEDASIKVAEINKKILDAPNLIIEEMIQNADIMNASINEVKSGFLDRLISEKDFKNVDEMVDFIGSYDEKLSESINNIFKAEIEEGKVLEKLEDFKTNVLSGLDFSEDLKSLVNTGDFLPMISLIDNVSEEIAKIDMGLKTEGLDERQIANLNAQKDSLLDLLGMVGEYTKTIKEGSTEAVKAIKMPYADLSSELAKATYQMKLFGASGENAFKLQIEGIFDLYEIMEAKQLHLVQDIGSSIGVGWERPSEDDLNDLGAEIKRLSELKNPTQENKDALEGKLRLYKEMDSLLALNKKRQLEIAKVHKDEREFKYKSERDSLDFEHENLALTNQQMQLLDKMSGVAKLDYEYKEKELKVQREYLNDALTLAKKNEDVSEQSKLAIEIQKVGVELLENEIAKRERIYNINKNNVKYSSEFFKMEAGKNDFWKNQYTQRKNILDLQKEENTKLFDLAVANNDLEEVDRLRLEGIRLQNEELQRQRDLYIDVANQITSVLTSLSRGEMPQFDMMAGFSRGLAELGDVKGKWGDMSMEGQLGVVAGGMDLLNNFMNIKLNAEMKSVQFEQEILAIRMQGATTEEEKHALLEQQLEMQKRAVDLAYQQQTAFMGVGNGTATAGLSGALGGATSGAGIGMAFGAAGGPIGAGIGAGVGLATGLIGGSSAKREAKRQKEALEYQRQMVMHLENVNKETNATNSYMRTIASDTSKIGLVGAQQKALNDIAINPSKYQLGGSADVAWNDRIWRGGVKRKHENNWKSQQATFTLDDFGYEATDLRDYKKVQNLQSQILAEKEKYAWTEDGYRNRSKADTQARANYLALEEMYENIEKISQTHENLGQKAFNTYFGGALQEIEDESGRVVDFFVDWSDFLATQFNNSYEQAMNAIIPNATSVTEQFFEGINNIFIQNYSSMEQVVEEMQQLYSDLATELAKNADEINYDYINITMDRLIEKTEEYKDAQSEVNDQVNEFLYTWLEKGGGLSDVYTSMTKSMQGMYDSIASGLKAENYEDMANNFGKKLGDDISDAMIKQMMDAEYSQAFMDLNNSLNNAIKTQSMDSITGLVGQSNAMLAQMENDRRQAEAISSLFDYDRKIDYVNQSQNIEVKTGTTKDVINNYNFKTEVNAGTIVATEESIDDLVYLIAPRIKNELDRTRG